MRLPRNLRAVDLLLIKRERMDAGNLLLLGLAWCWLDHPRWCWREAGQRYLEQQLPMSVWHALAAAQDRSPERQRRGTMLLGVWQRQWLAAALPPPEHCPWMYPWAYEEMTSAQRQALETARFWCAPRWGAAHDWYEWRWATWLWLAQARWTGEFSAAEVRQQLEQCALQEQRWRRQP
jgi:hypothetical protein